LGSPIASPDITIVSREPRRMRGTVISNMFLRVTHIFSNTMSLGKCFGEDHEQRHLFKNDSF
jgi:hypothetical protein